MTLFSLYSRKLTTKSIPTLPLSHLLKNPNVTAGIPDDILNEVGYRELLDKLITYGTTAITEFRTLRDKYWDKSTDE
jgi:hypothetical protein